MDVLHYKRFCDDRIFREQGVQANNKNTNAIAFLNKPKIILENF